MRKNLLSVLLLCLACGGIFGQEAGRQTPPAPGQAPAQQSPAQGKAQDQRTASQGQNPAERPAQSPAPVKKTAQPGSQSKSGDADKAVLVLDVNPFMWIFSGIPDENNNRSIFFDIGVQYNVIPGIALRFNPSFSFGFTKETAFTVLHNNFLELEFPLSFLCFPFPDETYLSPAFFGVSLILSYHNTADTGSGETVFVSVGAMMELGYQFKFSNHLVITPSIGISRIFPKPINGEAHSVPNFNVYSPWTFDTAVAPRIRVTLGFWL
ncbi:MAG: hypothetical protein LBO04_06435 [Spirochaetaceae bacterium]|jgi:hypothetical protein|nr:hypothetical protein [Spirochaetaceae bacterium]